MEFTKVLIAIYAAAILGTVAMLPKRSCPDSFCDGETDGDQELPTSDISGDQELPTSGISGDQELPASGISGDQELPMSGISGDQELPTSDISGDQELPTSGKSGVVETDIGGSMFYDHYLTCSSGIAYCRPCGAGGLYYSKMLKRCAYKNEIEEHLKDLVKELMCPKTTKEKKAAQEDCEKKGKTFSGNLVDTRNNINRKPTKIYMACWRGNFVECLPCYVPLVFYELKNWNSNEYYMYGHCGYPAKSLR